MFLCILSTHFRRISSFTPVIPLTSAAVINSGLNRVDGFFFNLLLIGPSPVLFLAFHHLEEAKRYCCADNCCFDY
jgi:hypothetical protein